MDATSSDSTSRSDPSSRQGDEFHLSAPSDAQLNDYQPLSILAVISLAVGVLSAMALLATPLWLVPMVGIAASAAALQSSALRSGTHRGRRLAAVGLALSLFFLSLSAARTLYYRHQIYADARRVADAWLVWVRQGQLEVAHQATLPPYRRQISAHGLRRYYDANEDLQNMLDEFFGQPETEQLVQAGDAAHYQFHSNVQQISDGQARYITLRYQVVVDGQSADPSLAEMQLKRFDAAKDKPVEWQVLGFAVASPPLK